jgi:hypothetical protein
LGIFSFIRRAGACTYRPDDIASHELRLEPDSNEIDESEVQYEKQDLHRILTDDRIAIDFNPLPENTCFSIHCVFRYEK